MFVQLTDAANVILHKRAPVLECGLCVVLRYLQTARHSLLLFGRHCSELVHTYSETVLDARVVRPQQMFQRQLVVERYEIRFGIALQSHVYVLQSCVHVMEYDVVVEHQQVQDEQESVYDQHDYDACEPCTIRPVVVVVQFEYVAL